MKREDRLRENLLILRHRMGLTVPQFARAAGIPEGTLKQRLREPSTFRLSEVWALDKLGERYGVDLRGGERGAAVLGDPGTGLKSAS